MRDVEQYFSSILTVTALLQISKALQELVRLIQTRESSNDIKSDQQQQQHNEVGVYLQLSSAIERPLSVGRRQCIDELEVTSKIQALVQSYIALVTHVRKK